MVAVLALLTTIIIQILETRKSRATRVVDLILGLEDRFQSPSLIEQRRAAARFLLQYNDVEDGRSLPPDDPKWEDMDDIIDFFQTLGTMTKTGHLSKELVYKFFFPWLRVYWSGADSYIKSVRKDPVVWADAEWLYQTVVQLEKKLNKSRRLQRDLDGWKRFVEAEATL